MMARPTTPHYGIAKYGERNTADPMDVYTVYNEAMETIDRIMFDLQGQVSANKKAISDLDAKVEKYNTALNTRIDNLDTKVENYKTELDNRITQLDQKVERYKTELDNSIKTVNQNITNLGSKTDAIWTTLQQILNKMQGGGSIDKGTGNITFGDTTGKIALGNINVNSGSGYIRTHEGTLDNDLKAV